MVNLAPTNMLLKGFENAGRPIGYNGRESYLANRQ